MCFNFQKKQCKDKASVNIKSYLGKGDRVEETEMDRDFPVLVCSFDWNHLSVLDNIFKKKRNHQTLKRIEPKYVSR